VVAGSLVSFALINVSIAVVIFEPLGDRQARLMFRTHRQTLAMLTPMATDVFLMLCKY
jgi:hypothetical protein